MTDRRLSGDEEFEALAAEYVLGLLEGEELKRARRSEAESVEFASLVERWNERFLPMLEEVPAVEPDPALWDRIAGSIEAPQARPVDIGHVRRRLTLWKGYSAAVTALAASLLLVIGLRTADQAPAPAPPIGTEQALMVASLASEEGPVSATAAYDAGTNSFIVAPAALSSVPDHDHELWIIPAGGAPLSLGLVRPHQTRRIALPATVPAALVESATMALSAEPAGGSPTGQPTGPVVASGTFLRI